MGNLLHPTTAHPAYSTPVSRKRRPARSAVLLSAAVLATLSACGGGSDGGSSPSNDAKSPPVRPQGVGDSYLFVSTPDFYFGTRDVGSQTTQTIEVSNRGADIYPISNIRLSGENAEEYSTGVYSDLTLNPSEVVKLDVVFSPITEGRKFADLAIDFETIKRATDAQNQNELRFYDARELEQRGRYPAAASEYRGYVNNDPVTVNKQRAAIKLPVLQESSTQGDTESFAVYLDAINARDAGDLTLALTLLDSALQTDSDSYMADDLLYLRGYIQLIDQRDYLAAIDTMKRLRQRHPDSSYYDTALYSEAQAHAALDNTGLAASIYEDLKYRHTGMDAFGISLPKDNLTSRLWFERASAGLNALGTA